MRKLKSIFAGLALLGVVGAGGAAMADEGLRGREVDDRIVVPSQARQVADGRDYRFGDMPSRRGFIWIRGHYQWNGRHRVFIPGHYERIRRSYR